MTRRQAQLTAFGRAGAAAAGGIGVGVYADRPAPDGDVRLYFATDGAVAEWVSDGAIWRPMVGGVLGVEPPTLADFNADWVAYNPGSAPFGVAGANGGLIFYGAQDAGPINRGWALPVPSTGDVSIEIAFADLTANFAGVSTFVLWGCGLRNSATEEAWVFSAARADAIGGTSFFFNITRWTDDVTPEPVPTQPRGQMLVDSHAAAFLRVRRDQVGNKYFAELSRDRQNWASVYNVTTPFTGVDQVIIASDLIGLNPNDGHMLMTSLEVIA